MNGAFIGSIRMRIHLMFHVTVHEGFVQFYSSTYISSLLYPSLIAHSTMCEFQYTKLSNLVIFCNMNNHTNQIWSISKLNFLFSVPEQPYQTIAHFSCSLLYVTTVPNLPLVLGSLRLVPISYIR